MFFAFLNRLDPHLCQAILFPANRKHCRNGFLLRLMMTTIDTVLTGRLICTACFCLLCILNLARNQGMHCHRSIQIGSRKLKSSLVLHIPLYHVNYPIHPYPTVPLIFFVISINVGQTHRLTFYLEQLYSKAPQSNISVCFCFEFDCFLLFVCGIQ